MKNGAIFVRAVEKATGAEQLALAPVVGDKKAPGGALVFGKLER